MRVISTTNEQTVTCRCGCVFGYVPADVVRAPVPTEPRNAAPVGVTIVGEWKQTRSVTCPCCFRRVILEGDT